MPSKDFLLEKETIKRIDTIRIIYFITFLLFFAITEFGRFVYRPFIYENNIYDFGLADSIGNLGGIIVQSFFGLTIINSTKEKGLRLIIFFAVGYVLYEIAQPYLPKGVFDWKDIYGTLLGGITGLLIFLSIHKVIKQNRIFWEF